VAHGVSKKSTPYPEPSRLQTALAGIDNAYCPNWSTFRRRGSIVIS
jgi:hypothetical protein